MYDRFSPNIFIYLNTLLARSLVTIIFNITCRTHSTGSLACDFFIAAKAGLISKSFSKGVKSCLNSDILSKTTLRGCGYLMSYLLLNNWLTLAYGLSMYSLLPPVTSLSSYFGNLMILNQPIAGLIIIIQVILTVFLIILPTKLCFLIDLLYGPIRSTFTESHGFSSAMFLGGRFP